MIDIASGGSDDWATGTLHITYSYTLELPPTGGNGFIVPVSEIKRTGNDIFVMNTFIDMYIYIYI